jgi:hypothetical protein
MQLICNLVEKRVILYNNILIIDRNRELKAQKKLSEPSNQARGKKL